MKFFNVLLLMACSIYFLQGVYSQQPYLPKFKQADPIWQHALVNPLFQKHPNGRIVRNPYTCVSTQLTTELIVDSFMISVIPTSGELVFLDALIVQKININSGEILWKDIIYDATIDSIGWVSVPYIINKRTDGKIEFLGTRKILNDNIQIFNYSYRAVYDFETGERTLYYDKSDRAEYPDKFGSLNGRYFKLKEDSLYLKAYNYSEGSEQPKRGISFCLVNGNQDSVQFLKTILIDPQMPVHVFTFRFLKLDILNDSIFALLYNLEAPQGSDYAGKNILYLFNIKDINNIHLVKSIDLSEYAIYDRRPGGIPHKAMHFNVYDGKLYIMGQYYDIAERKQFNYFLKLDDSGGVMDYINKVETNDNTFYLHYIPITITDSLKLFWAFKSKMTDKVQSYDIVKMNDNQEMEYVASFFPEGDKGEYFDIHKTYVIDNKLIFYGVYALGNTIDENGEGRYTYYFLAFDMDELIKGSTTVTTSEPIDIGHEVVIYPNPTRDKFYITGVEDIINIDIFDNQGRVYPLNTSSYEMIDIESYPSGVYFIKIKTKDSYKTLRVVKQ